MGNKYGKVCPKCGGKNIAKRDMGSKIRYTCVEPFWRAFYDQEAGCGHYWDERKGIRHAK